MFWILRSIFLSLSSHCIDCIIVNISLFKRMNIVHCGVESFSELYRSVKDSLCYHRVECFFLVVERILTDEASGLFGSGIPLC